MKAELQQKSALNQDEHISRDAPCVTARGPPETTNNTNRNNSSYCAAEKKKSRGQRKKGKESKMKGEGRIQQSSPFIHSFNLV